jgi:hypothetical protein
MIEEVAKESVFTIRLAPDDWDPTLGAWRCPALDIPSAFIKEAYDSKGQPLSLELLKIDKGPARVSWRGPERPPQIALAVGLGEELSPTSEENFWKRFAIVVPIITAVIAALATYWSRPGPAPVSGSTTYTLRLRVDPNDVVAFGLPPARIIVNSQELQQPIDYKITSDVIAIIDVSKAFNAVKALGAAYQDQKSVVGTSVGNLNAVFNQLNDLNAHVNGDICSGGSSGTPSPVRNSLSSQTVAISNKLRGINSDLQAAIAKTVMIPQ